MIGFKGGVILFAIGLIQFNCKSCISQYDPELFQESFVAWRDEINEYACAMFIELDVNSPDPNADSFTESWQLHTHSGQYHRHDVKDISQTFANGGIEDIIARPVTTIITKDKVVQKVWDRTISTSRDSADKNDQENYQRHPFFDALTLCYVGNAVLKDRNVIPPPQDALMVIFGRSKFERAEKVEDRIKLLYLANAAMNVYEVVIVDKKYGYMPTSIVRSIGQGDKAEVFERINTSWVPHGNKFFPHETSIEQIVGKLRKRWSVKYYWMLRPPKIIWDHETNWIEPLELRDLILEGAFNRKK